MTTAPARRPAPVTAREVTGYLRVLFPEITPRVRHGPGAGEFRATMLAQAAVHWGLGTPSGVSAAAAGLTRLMAFRQPPARARITGPTPKQTRSGRTRMSVITITITPAPQRRQP